MVELTSGRTRVRSCRIPPGESRKVVPRGRLGGEEGRYTAETAEGGTGMRRNEETRFVVIFGHRRRKVAVVGPQVVRLKKGQWHFASRPCSLSRPSRRHPQTAPWSSRSPTVSHAPASAALQQPGSSAAAVFSPFFLCVFCSLAKHSPTSFFFPTLAGPTMLCSPPPHSRRARPQQWQKCFRQIFGPLVRPLQTDETGLGQTRYGVQRFLFGYHR